MRTHTTPNIHNPTFQKANKRTVTFKDLINGIDADVPKNDYSKWEYYIETAKRLLSETELNRMAIAEIAIRSCHISWGGDVKSERFKEYDKAHTLKRFAKAVGLNYHTLSRWVRTKTKVFDHLTQTEQRHFKYSQAENAADKLRKYADGKEDPAIARELYHKFEKTDPKRARAERIMSYLKQATFQICEKNAKALYSKEELNDIRALLKKMLHKLG